MTTPQKNDVVTLDIEDLAYGGMGVGRIGTFVVFVDKALPSERVRARVVKKKSNHAQAVLESIERASPHRIEQPPCPHYGICGGCTLEHLTYDQQLAWKQKQVGDTIRHIGGLEGVEIRPILRSPKIWRYRNKMEFSFGADRDGQPILGFHVPRRFDRIFEVRQCCLQPQAFDQMLAVLTEYARTHGLRAYDKKSHAGFLRHAVMRHSHTTGECILALVTTRGDLPEPEGLARMLSERVDGFKGMIQAIHQGVADVARLNEVHWRWGEPELMETVNGLSFRISPASFFQTNTLGAEVLYQQAIELAELSETNVVLDAYCGTGSIGLQCAGHVRHVVGVESVLDAVWNARENAARNGVRNTTFVAAPLKEGLRLGLQGAGGHFDRVVIDPPRGGMDKKSLAGLIGLEAPVFIYVSCNPATLSRDLQALCGARYEIKAVQPVDMFPHTYHIETVLKLRLG